MATRPEDIDETRDGGGARRLAPCAIAKPWGRTRLGPWGLGLCDAMAGAAIGEIHHCTPDGGDPELLVKTLFTSERLSVQVHPDATAARALGHARGKDEAWVVLAAEPGATIGLGLRAECDVATLRAAALDGSIADMLNWHACAPGDVFFTPAGTIHAIGAGVTVFEVQQNSDVTYRLFDYGRGRSLHLDEGLAVAKPVRWDRRAAPQAPMPNREVLVEGPAFVLERVRLNGQGGLHTTAGRPVWMAVVAGSGQFDGRDFAPGEVWMTDAVTMLSGDAELLLAYSGAAAANDLWMHA